MAEHRLVEIDQRPFARNSAPPSAEALVRHVAEASSDSVYLQVRRGTTTVSVRVTDSARSQVAEALGLAALPGPNAAAATALGTCLWVRPDGWLVCGDGAVRQEVIDTLGAAVPPHDGAVVDISASHIVLELGGPASRDVLASCCPLDLHPRAFKAARCAQTLISKAPVLVHLVDETPQWRLHVRPSLTAYVVAWLTDAMPEPSPVRHDKH